MRSIEMKFTGVFFFFLSYQIKEVAISCMGIFSWGINLFMSEVRFRLCIRNKVSLKLWHFNGQP